MGYTHYWTFVPKRGDATKNEKSYQNAIKKCSKVIRSYSKQFGGLSGYSAHSDTYGGINVNGSERVGQCESFILREHLNQNEAFNFCKTGRYQYDTVVTACLIILKHYLKDAVSIGSDGYAHEWNDGLILARQLTGLKTLSIPSQIDIKEKVS